MRSDLDSSVQVFCMSSGQGQRGYLPGRSRWHHRYRCQFLLLVRGGGFGLQQTPLALGVPLPGLLPQVLLQQVGLVHRPPGTPPPAGQALALLEHTQPPGSEAPGPRTAWACGVCSPFLLGVSLTHRFPSVLSPLLSLLCFKASYSCPALLSSLSLAPSLGTPLPVSFCVPQFCLALLLLSLRIPPPWQSME